MGACVKGDGGVELEAGVGEGGIDRDAGRTALMACEPMCLEANPGATSKATPVISCLSGCAK
jgi:hypothetical protein